MNLGSPDAPKPNEVKKYLNEFLMDKYVIDIPYIFRWLLVKGIILNTRPKKSAQAYSKIWTPNGSPLIHYSEKTKQNVETLTNIPIALAMRYGNPSIEKGLSELYKQGVTDVLLIPLYPQYAMATTKSIEEKTKEVIKQKFPHIHLTVFKSFYNDENYIDNLSRLIKENLTDFPYQHLLFSYHGVPERHLAKADPTKKHNNIKIIPEEYCCTPGSLEAQFCYRTQCFETTKAVAKKLQLNDSVFSQAFQSRLGNDKWLEPFTVDKLAELGKKGVKNLAVATPAFVADCVETLEEIALEGAKVFKENGGEQFLMIPCLNDNPQWMQTIAQWINNWNQEQKTI